MLGGCCPWVHFTPVLSKLYTGILNVISSLRLPDLNFYHREALHAHASIMTGESTPSYLLHSDLVLPRLQSTLPSDAPLKLLVMLRNPTARAFSHFNMSIDMTGNAEQTKNR